MTEILCRFCTSADGSVVVDLGRQPGSELFPPLDTRDADPRFALRLWLCADCGLAQLADDVGVPEDPQGTQPDALTRQFVDAVGRLAAADVLPISGSAIEFPSPHGGTWLPLLAGYGITAADAGDTADIVIDCCFGMMHAADQAAALHERAAALAPGGTLVVQFQSLASMLEHREWNAVRHGHYAYYSVPAMRRMLEAVGLKPCSAWWFSLYGGTVLMTARHGGTSDAALDELTEQELAAGVLDVSAVAALEGVVQLGVAQLTDWLKHEMSEGRRVYGYGAASRAVPLLCNAGVDRSLLAAVADNAVPKHGCRMPGTDIPVISLAELVAAQPDSVLLFVPDLLDEVRRSLPDIEAGHGRWFTMGMDGPR